jgi:hypothetical protein
VGSDPEERRVEPRGQRGAANEGREGDRRRGQQVPPALETNEASEPSLDTSIREEPYPHEEERPRHHGLERPWWRRILRAPREEGRWWEFWR